MDIDQANPVYSQSLGIVKFSLGMIANQEEYDVVLEIPDPDDENSVSAKINAKIQFIWSFFRLYSEKLSKTEENIYNLQLSLQKKRTLLGHLNGICPYLLLFSFICLINSFEELKMYLLSTLIIIYLLNKSYF